MEKKALLIDGNALLYKAFHASYFPWLKEVEREQAMIESQGLEYNRPEPVNAIRTFTMMMISLKRRFNDHNILVAFDAKDAKTYRSEFDYYKAGRSKTPDDLNVQRESIFRVLDLLGFEYAESPELEADDIIGILSKKYSDEGVQVDIVTGDKDLLQLVNENVKVHISKTGVSEMQEYNINNFAELTNGLNPNQIRDLKGIMGDNSDNLAGIKGIGEKGALKLLLEFETLENVYENRTTFSESICRKIEDGYEHGIECKHIATIITEHEFNIEYENISLNTFEKYELSGFLKGKSIYKLAEEIEKLEW